MCCKNTDLLAQYTKKYDTVRLLFYFLVQKWSYWVVKYKVDYRRLSKSCINILIKV